jgi:hypothetical protein
MLRVALFMASQSQKTKASSIRRVNARLRIQSVNRVLSLTLTLETPIDDRMTGFTKAYEGSIGDFRRPYALRGYAQEWSRFASRMSLVRSQPVSRTK